MAELRHRSVLRRLARPSRTARIAFSLLSPLVAWPVQAAGEIALPAISSIDHVYIEGREATDPGSGALVETGQTYVQAIRLAVPRRPMPVLLLPGGSLSGAVYETTPDGRPGWLTDFLAAGLSVLIADSGQTGRSPPAPAALQGSPAILRSKAFLWEIFRIGPPGSWSSVPKARRAYADSLFPLAAFDNFARQAFPRYRPPVEDEVARYGALVDRLCPCIVIAHSAAGPIAERAALNRPDKIAALVLIEPSGGIGLSPAQAQRLKPVPHLFLWGDHLDQPGWPEQYKGAAADRAALTAAGTLAETVNLPAVGVTGNSHMLMLDHNSSRIAGLILHWLDRHLDRPKQVSVRPVQKTSPKGMRR